MRDRNNVNPVRYVLRCALRCISAEYQCVIEDEECLLEFARCEVGLCPDVIKSLSSLGFGRFNLSGDSEHAL